MIFLENSSSYLKNIFSKITFHVFMGAGRKDWQRQRNLTWVEVPKYDTEDDHTISF